MEYLTTDRFKSDIMDYTSKEQKFVGKRPTIVKMTANWCSPCKMINPILEEIEKEYEGKLDIYNVDVDKEHEVAAAFGVRSIPMMVFFPLKGQAESMMGALPKKLITDAIKRIFKL